MFDRLIENTWKRLLTEEEEFDKAYLSELASFLEAERMQGKLILPPQELWFAALNHTPLDQVKVVILGQDPYPTLGHGHGLCFSVEPDVTPLPKSLLNINKELASDCGIDNSHTGYLLPWAKQGVLLLNAVLTVEASKTHAHKAKGWEKFTDQIIRLVNAHCEHVVFILWGSYAQKKGACIDKQRHLIINDPHPSPLSAYRGFWGSKPFSKTNAYLEAHDKVPIEWQLPKAL